MRQNSYCTKQVVFQFGQYLEKYLRYSLNIGLGHLHIQKSFKKQSQALKIYTTTLLLALLQAHYCSSFNPNTAL